MILLYLVMLLLSTFLLELIPLLFLRRRWEWFRVSLLCNVITNPLINTILLMVGAVSYSDITFVIVALVLELLIIPAEAWIYRNLLGESWKKCLMVSLIANVFSFGVGFLVLTLPDLVAAPPKNPSYWMD